jgi:hypothetical protein
VLIILNEGIARLVYSKCNPFVVDGVMCVTWRKMIAKFTNPKITSQNQNKWIDTKMFK